MSKASNLQLIIFNITIAAYEIPLFPNTVEVDDELQFVGMLKEFWELYAKFTRTRYTIKIADEGTWGTWEDGVGYTDGVLGMMQNNEANKVHMFVPIGLKEPPGVFTGVLKEETHHILSIASQTSTINNNLLIKLLIFEPTCWLMYFVSIFSLLCVCDYLSNGQKLLNLLSRLKFIFFQMVQITFKQNPTINCRCEFMLLACSTVAILIAISGAAFNTNAITGTIGEQVNHLMDIVRLNKIPVFIEGESMYESFEEGLGKEFRAVHDQARKFKMAKPVGFDTITILNHLTEHNCLKGSIIAAKRSILIGYEAIELFCSQASKRRLFTHVSSPFHTTVILSLINPGNNGSIGNELIRRDGAFSNFMFEGGILQTSAKYIRNNAKTVKNRLIALYGLKTNWPIQDDSSHLRPLNFSNFELIFKLIIFLEVIILMSNVFYQIFNTLFPTVQLKSVSLV